MNSVMGPVCHLSLAQCSHVMLLFTNSVFVPCTVLACDVTVHVLKKKKRGRKCKRGFGNVNPNRHLVLGSNLN